MTDKIIQLKLDQRTFELLEVLSVGLLREMEGCEEKEMLMNKCSKRDSLTPLVSRLLVQVADSLAQGTRRSGSWEREVISRLTGWQGTFVPDMFGKTVSKADFGLDK